MDPMTAMAASGLRSRMESLDLVANNVANASTGGYKADREFYSLYVSPEAGGCGPDRHHAGDRAAVDRSRAGRASNPPATPSTLALSGKGFSRSSRLAGRCIPATAVFTWRPTARWLRRTVIR